MTSIYILNTYPLNGIELCIVIHKNSLQAPVYTCFVVRSGFDELKSDF